MCPDREILSAYSDNELDSVLSETIASHIEECSACRRELVGFQSLSGVLTSRSRDEETVEEAARMRVWRGIMRRRDKRSYLPPVLRYLRMPLPVLLLVAVLSMGLGAGGSVLLVHRRAAVAEAPMPEIPAEVTIESMDELLAYLKRSEKGINITIELPEEPLFIVVGEPQLLRAAEYRRGE